MSMYGDNIDTFDYLQGGSVAIEQNLQQAVANVSPIGATGTAAQIVGFDASGNPAPKNVQGDANGAGLAFSGDTLIASLPQDLRTIASPTFLGTTITGQLTAGDLKIGTGPVVKNFQTGDVSINPGSIAAQSRGYVDVTLAGLAVDDIVVLQPPIALNAGLVYAGCRPYSSNTLRVYLGNLTGAAIDDDPQNWIYAWLDLT